MITNELRQYIENNIFPIYNNNEQGHGIEHVKYVINRSFEIVEDKKLDVNKDIVFTVASYHDIGHYIDKDNHEKISAEIMFKDENLKTFFTEEELIIIKNAIEDHRSSSKTKPRTIYGDIVKLADKNTKINQFFERCCSYSLKHYPSYTTAEHIERIYNHGKDKFGKEGYALLEFTDSKYENYLIEFQKLLENRKLFDKKVIKILKMFRNRTFL